MHAFCPCSLGSVAPWQGFGVTGRPCRVLTAPQIEAGSTIMTEGRAKSAGFSPGEPGQAGPWAAESPTQGQNRARQRSSTHSQPLKGIMQRSKSEIRPVLGMKPKDGADVGS